MPTRDVGYRRDVLIDIPAKTSDVTVNPVRYSRKLQVESWSAVIKRLAQVLRGRYAACRLCYEDQAAVDRDEAVAIGCHEAYEGRACRGAPDVQQKASATGTLAIAERMNQGSKPLFGQ